jgi:hypothetical protein
MRHDRICANWLGGAFSVLLLGFGVTTALQVSLNRSVVEEIGWDLKGEGYSVAVRVYKLFLDCLLILFLAHRRDAAYVTLGPRVAGALTPPAAPKRCPPCFNCQLPAFKCGNVCSLAVS